MARKKTGSIYDNVKSTGSPEPMIWRLGAYLRLSKEDMQRSSKEAPPSNESNESFIRMLERYAKKHVSSRTEFSASIINQWKRIETYLNDNSLEFELVQVYIDDGLSGATDNRNDFQNMLDDCKAKKINCIIVPDSSRFARNYADCEYYVEEFFKIHSTRFIALGSPHVDSVKDPSSVSGMQFHFTNYFNEYFLKQTSEKILHIFSDKRRRGEFIGSFAPLGYKKDPTNKNQLIIDEDAADIIRKIFDLFVYKGYSVRQICLEFTAQGVPSMMQYLRAKGHNILPQITPKQYVWNYHSIRKILRDERYCGHMVQGKSARISYKNKQQINKPREEWVIVYNTHEAIIDDELFHKAQTIIERSTRVSPTGERSKYSGLLFCTKCGYAVNCKRNSRTRERGYVCKFHQMSKKCEPLHISEIVLDERVLYAIRSQIALLADMGEVYNKILVSRQYTDDSKVLQGSYDILKKQLDSLEAKSHRLYDSYDEGLITKELYASRSVKLKAEIDDVSDKMAKLQREMRQCKDANVVTNDFLERFKKYETVTEIDRELLVELVDKIFIENVGAGPTNSRKKAKKVTVVFKFEDEFQILKQFIDGNKLVNF